MARLGIITKSLPSVKMLYKCARVLFNEKNNSITLFFFNRAIDFIPNYLGLAYINKMCSQKSVALVKDTHYSVTGTGTVFAHELGHLFDMYHDNGE